MIAVIAALRQVGRGGEAGQVLKIMDQMGLIKIAGCARQIDPIHGCPFLPFLRLLSPFAPHIEA